ncbi:Ldh family oxidoreductase [Aliiroseovarius sediminis]|uniref:Ldh family oxidoreductase n=1 Tax=Aliiroseovarius sediminis TaxID=2925839 RepID=UPI001F5690BC|nr:Ldh family oxidoreductase [Aliiroseovarius sediminis]MCI2393843.1 Ldh family oxidoreductase [Aliiroseovarius sediminis]
MRDGFVSIDALTERVTAIIANAGFSADHAAALARTIVAGERDGCKSHGIYRIAGCLRTLEAGKVVPDADPVVAEPDGAIVRVDAKGGFANLAFTRGLPVLAEQARKSGLAAMVINDCVHFAALWPEIEDITAEGLAGMAMCPSYATVAPAGGTQPLLGTNPFAFGWPREGQPPYVFDFATSVVARGEVELYRRAGDPLPDGWALDADGQPTNDPEAALDGAMLPFGGHKGSAISTMIELLAGAMIGDFTSDTALEWLGTTTIAPRHGELILAFDPARFAGGRADPRATAEAFIGAIEGQGARLPGQRRFAARDKAMNEGIALTAAEFEELDRLEKEGVA